MKKINRETKERIALFFIGFLSALCIVMADTIYDTYPVWACIWGIGVQIGLAVFTFCCINFNDED